MVIEEKDSFRPGRMVSGYYVTMYSVIHSIHDLWQAIPGLDCLLIKLKTPLRHHATLGIYISFKIFFSREPLLIQLPDC